MWGFNEIWEEYGRDWIRLLKVHHEIAKYDKIVKVQTQK